MNIRRVLAQLNSLFGLAAAFYAFSVEQKLGHPGYVPGCSGIFGGDCGAVFSSSYGHLLSHWGLVPRGHPLDLSLAVIGIILYTCYFVALSYPRPWPYREVLFLTVAVAGALFSCYLLYVIKFILKEFCIVCASFHTCNFLMLLLAISEYRRPSTRPKRE